MALAVPRPDATIKLMRHDTDYWQEAFSPESAFFGDFLLRWTKSYPPQPHSGGRNNLLKLAIKQNVGAEPRI